MMQTSSKHSNQAARRGRLLAPSPLGLAARLLDLGIVHQTMLRRLAGRGRITIMFTDIVDFTSTTESGGERAAMRLLDAHDDLVTPRVRQNGGRVVKSLGDGIMAAFPDSADAAKAAVGILEDLQGRNGSGQPLRLRIGIDTGQPRRRGDDFVGHTVNVAARLTRRARPDEALVTEAVRRASKDAGRARWTERGHVPLKGVTRPPKTWRLRPAARSPKSRTKRS